jgi:protein-disulfide isomerase-like protein with CxxC motif
MTDPADRIRQILERHYPFGQSDHARRVAEDIVAQLGLRRDNVENKMRYVSAWFDDELTKLEGAE